MNVASELPVNQLNIRPFNDPAEPRSGLIGTENPSSTSKEIAQPPTDPVIVEPSKSDETFYAGRISLNLFYSRTEFTEISLQKKNMGESMAVKEQLYKKFEATLSIDVSFMAKFEGVHDRVREIDPSVLSKWASVTENLLKLEDGGAQTFVDATDELFNEIETAIGLESNALDDMSGFFKEQLNQFISSVKEQVDLTSIDTPKKSVAVPSNEFIPQILDEMKLSLKDNLKDFIHTKFEELVKKFLENQKKDFLPFPVDLEALV